LLGHKQWFLEVDLIVVHLSERIEADGDSAGEANEAMEQRWDKGAEQSSSLKNQIQYLVT
jgi:hypothetical protein